MARRILQPMPRRHPLPPPVLPTLVARLDELRLEGADRARLELELALDAELAREVSALRALDAPRGASTRELRDLALAAWLQAELRRTGEPLAARRRAAEALLAARLGARIARRAVRPVALPATELFCLPLLLALAAARLDPELGGGSETAAREAARLAGAWGFSGAALEVLAQSARASDEACLLELARRLASGDEPRSDLGRAALERPARALGLRPAELAELADFAAAARATAAA